MIPLVIFGAGGFGREIWSIARAINSGKPTYELLGFVDDGLTEANAAALARLDAPHLGGSDWAVNAPAGTHGVIGIGSASVRRSIHDRFPSLAWATLIHPDTTLGSDVEIGPGSVVAPGTRLSTTIRLGRHVHVDQNVTVGHDSSLGDFSRLNPQACISGNVSIAEGATVGASATVIQGLTVGADALVGAGAVVTRHVPGGAVVKGVPAK